MSKNVRQNRRREPKLRQMDRQGWVSLFGVIAKIVVTCVIAIGIPYGVYLYYLHLVETGYFLPKTVNVHGNFRVDRAAIMEASGLEDEGTNLFEADVHTIEASVETIPWVRKAKIRIDLPDAVDIGIEEFDPLGIVNDGQLYVVDGDGQAIKPWSSGDELMSPLVSLDVPLAERPDAVVQAFRLGELVVRLGYPHKVQEIHYDDATGFTLYTETTEIRLGYDRFEERIDRLITVDGILKERDVIADYILLDADTTLDRIVVKPAPRPAAVIPQEPENTSPDVSEPSDTTLSNPIRGDVS